MMFFVACSKRAGFTLIEIMIVIAIIAILAGIVVPNIGASRAEAQLVACRQNILTIVRAIEQALIRHTRTEMIAEGNIEGMMGQGDAFLINHGYLEKIPRCPKSDGGKLTNYIIHINTVSATKSRPELPLVYVRCGLVSHKVGDKSIAPCYNIGSGEEGTGWHDM